LNAAGGGASELIIIFVQPAASIDGYGLLAASQTAVVNVVFIVFNKIFFFFFTSGCRHSGPIASQVCSGALIAACHACSGFGIQR